MNRYRGFHTDLSTHERLALIADYPIREILSAPGHQSLRDPASVRTLEARFRSGDFPDVWEKPILIGVFTREEAGEVVLKSVECLDGHHRLLAALHSSRWQLLGELPWAWLDVRVNGWPEHGTAEEERWIPLEVAQRSSVPWARVDPSWKPTGPTARIAGKISGRDPRFVPEDRGIPFSGF